MSGVGGSDGNAVDESGEGGVPETPTQLSAVGASVGRGAGKGKGKRALFDMGNVSGDSGLEIVHASGDYDLRSEVRSTRTR